MSDYNICEEIVIVRGSNDILNPFYLSTISDNAYEYPSVEHHCQFQILLRCGLVTEARELLDIRHASNCVAYVKKLIADRYRSSNVDGMHVERAQRFWSENRQDILPKALMLRLRQDYAFRRALMDTKSALLIFCDADDFEFSVGMEERAFLNWVSANGLTAERLLHWFRRYETCPFSDVLGANKLGLALMDVRAVEMERLLAPSPPTLPPTVRTIPAAPNLKPVPATPATIVLPPPPPPVTAAVLRPPQDLVEPVNVAPTPDAHSLMYQRYLIDREDELEQWTVSDQILALEGIYALLSQFYVTPFVTSKRRYRSVEHYAYQKLFRRLKLSKKFMEKLRTTPDPSKLGGLALNLLSSVPDARPDDDEPAFYNQLMQFYERATKLKFEQHPSLRRLLVATGDSLLIETCPASDQRSAFEWTLAVSEAVAQRTLTASTYTTEDLLRWMLKRSDEQSSKFFSNRFGRNRAGLALMRLRRAFRAEHVDPLTFPPPPPTGGELEDRLVCFTRGSVFHPAYVAPFWTKDGELYSSVEQYLCLEAARQLGFSAWVSAAITAADVDELDAAIVNMMYEQFPEPDRLLRWFWHGGRDEAFKFACRLKFEKHPDLLRALLETGDSLLVYCRPRLSSEDTEWSIGASETDVAQFMAECRMDCRQLLRMTLSAPDLRPAFMGGNRLGALLMELRRDFRLRGVQPHTLPKLELSSEVVLGSSFHETVDDVDFGSWTDAVWPTPYFLLAKKRGQPVLDRPNRKRKFNETQGKAPTLQPSSAPVTAASVVGLMNVEQLKQLTLMLVSKLSAMRRETDWEGETLRQLLDDFRQFCQRLDEVVNDNPAVPTANADQNETVQKVQLEKDKVTAFESGLLSALKVRKDDENATDDKSLFEPAHWDETRVRPLIDRVWSHLTQRERLTATDWLRHTIIKLSTIRAGTVEEPLSEKTKQPNSEYRSFISSDPSNCQPEEAYASQWIVPQLKMTTTSEGTFVDTEVLQIDWSTSTLGAFTRQGT